MWDSAEYAQEGRDKMLAGAREHARSMDKVYSKSRVCIMQTRLRQFTLRTGVVWKSSRENGVKLEVFRDPDFDYVSGEWTRFDIDVGVSVHYFRISIDIQLLFIGNRRSRHLASKRHIRTR